MMLKPLGDAAWLIEFPHIRGEEALALVNGWVMALKSNRPDGVLDVVPSFNTVAVHYGKANGVAVREWIEAVTVRAELLSGAEKTIAVCYGGDCGPDLEEVATRVGLTPSEVIALHSGATYTVAAVGFSPGFPYFLELPDRLKIPRRETPRLAVAAGSVAIAGGQAGIYPNASPGGWHVLGRTTETLFDPLSARPALLSPGDRVRFVSVKTLVTEVREISPRIESTCSRWIEVVEPGGMTTVQDLGRPGYESGGVSPGGAVDRDALRMANWLIGNDEGAAALELCVRGPVLRFHGAATVALMAATGKSRCIKDGETVDFSKLTGGVRACLSLAGGIEVPQVLGSAATDLRAGFGGYEGRALQVGDRLEIGAAGRVPRCGGWHVGRADLRRGAEIEIRFLPGTQQDWFSNEAFRRFRETHYQLTPNSDRMGARLAGAKLELAEPREMLSQPVACGSVQVPPDGQPIILLAERQTIGGYPQIGHVISVDLPKLARAWPGAFVKFREVTLEEAWRLRDAREREFAWLRSGLDLLT